MIIDKPGIVTDRILFLGRKESCVYLLIGAGEYVMLGGGMTYIIPDVIRQIKALKIEEKKIKQIIILHSHFDHCGMVPFFKKRWPWVKVTASARAKELLSSPKVIVSNASLNQVLLTEYGYEKQAKELGFEFDGVKVEDVVKEGDVRFCGDLSMEVIDVPGHSSCSIAVYIPQEKAMFASDAGGIPFGEQVFTAANSNIDKYQESLAKMAEYEIDVYLAEHYGARTGDDASGYLKKSMKAAKETRNILEASYSSTKDVEKSTKEITDMLMSELPAGFMRKDIIAIVAGQMLRYIARQMSV